MISKKNLSKSQRFSLFLIDMTEMIGNSAKWIVLFGFTLTGSILLHQQINKRILNNCDRTIYQVVETPTAFGLAYSCVSRAQMYGPATPLKD